jgi:predicted Holliday junction resolvase-like endonuclease
MEMASGSSLLRTLAIIILCYYLFKFLMRIFAPIIMQKAVNKMQEKMQEQYNKQQQQQQQNTTTQSTQFQSKEKEKVGDYIDYEEIN